MILEATFSQLEKPFLYMRSLLTETEYKTEKHPVTIEVKNDETFFYFYDKKAKVEMIYKIEEATASLEGVATCSMKALYDILKTFKKSEDIILIEREDNFLRIDDGVFPEEIIVLYDDEQIVVTDIEELDSPLNLAVLPAGVFSDALIRSGVILKKTDIPAEVLDSQSVYVRGKTGGVICQNVFSMHNSYSETFSGMVESPFTLRIPKALVSLLSRITMVLEKQNEKIRLIQSYLDGQEFFVLENEEKSLQIAIKGKYLLSENGISAFEEVEANLNMLMERNETITVSNLTLPGKMSASTNLVFSKGGLEESQYGYQGKLIKDFIQKNAISPNSEWFETDDKILVIRDNSEDSKKMMVLSYRSEKTA